MWDSLFLTLPEIEEVLEQVTHRERIPQAHAMFVFAAHTGARRSEIRRALISDFDFDNKAVMIREKKREHDKRETYRTVPMSPLLECVMRAGFADHPAATARCAPRPATRSLSTTRPRSS